MMSIVVCIVMIINSINCESLEIDDNSMTTKLNEYKYSMVNFYVNWCRFCVLFKPEYELAANIIKNEYKDVILGKVNCEINKNVCDLYKVRKYPTVLVFRKGRLSKEYNKDRSSNALVDFVKNDLNISPFIIKSYNDIDNTTDRVVVELNSINSLIYSTIKDLLSEYHDDCKSYIILNPSPSIENIHFYVEGNMNKIEKYENEINVISMNKWLNNKCRPLVKEITFRNAEIITGEGFPLLIHFYSESDDSSKSKFVALMEKFVNLVKGAFKPVHAKAQDFHVALTRIGKTVEDVPLLAIDDYRHIYAFEHPLTNIEEYLIIFIISIESKFEQFIHDFATDKLHADLHRKQDNVILEQIINALNQVPNRIKIQHELSIQDSHKPISRKPITTAPNDNDSPQQQKVDSVFKNLAPDESRYTLARDFDEL